MTESREYLEPFEVPDPPDDVVPAKVEVMTEPPDVEILRRRARQLALVRYAIVRRNRPLICRPLRAWKSTSRPKVSFRTEEDALAASRALEKLGSEHMKAYFCAYEARVIQYGPHFHLSARVPPPVPTEYVEAADQ